LHTAPNFRREGTHASFISAYTVYFLDIKTKKIMIYETPRAIRKLIQLTLFITISILIVEALLNRPIKELFLLSPDFYSSLYLWQPLSAMFFYPLSSLAFGSLFDLIFLIGLLWLFSTQTSSFLGIRKFFFLYFSSGFIAALFSGLFMYITGIDGAISLIPPALLALACVWTICTPPQNLFAFFFFPFQPKWFLIIALIGTIGANLVSNHYVETVAYLAAFVWSWLVAVMGWYLKGPFQSLYRIEAYLKRISYACSAFISWKIAPHFRGKNPHNGE
jgi:hypothetical protein